MKRYTAFVVAVLWSLAAGAPAVAQTLSDFHYFVGPGYGVVYDLDVDGTDHLYMAQKDSVLVVQPDGTIVTSLKSALFDQVNGLAVDRATGDLYVANKGNGTIVKVTDVMTTPAYTTWQTGLSGPFDVAISGGLLYVSEMAAGEVERFSLADGTAQGTITGLTAPSGMAFDVAGNLYVANTTGTSGATISMIAGGGTTVTQPSFAMLGAHRSGFQPWFLTFGPVRLGDSNADQLFPADDSGYPQLLYVSDYQNRYITYVESDGTVNDAYLLSGNPRPTGIAFDALGSMMFGVSSSYSTFAVLKSNAAFPVLPVELVSFEALADGDRVVLTWTTASETNNAGFEVQRGTGTSFEPVAFVEGRGTTTEAQRYEYALADLPAGRHVFRLKQVDFDGAYEYSPEVEVTIEVAERYQLSAAYPNPFNPQTQFTLTLAQSEPVTITVFDVLGRAVATLHDGWLEAGTAHTFAFRGDGLTSGTYLIQARGESFRATRTVTLLK
ncbi:MAG: T9SS C-terminal target domain-containing protein [Bacteroidetes bacterium]|nr:hypothetical protein AWN76_000935 [Rhodothermaceae bacterium RA]RMH53254.1 MAG: T9SS C-terminal target domain-containing protein [Bacteroidota bacterium]